MFDMAYFRDRPSGPSYSVITGIGVRSDVLQCLLERSLRCFPWVQPLPGQSEFGHHTINSCNTGGTRRVGCCAVGAKIVFAYLSIEKDWPAGISPAVLIGILAADTLGSITGPVMEKIDQRAAQSLKPWFDAISSPTLPHISDGSPANNILVEYFGCGVRLVSVARVFIDALS